MTKEKHLAEITTLAKRLDDATAGLNAHISQIGDELGAELLSQSASLKLIVLEAKLSIDEIPPDELGGILRDAQAFCDDIGRGLRDEPNTLEPS